MCSGPYVGSLGRMQFEEKVSNTVSKAQGGGRVETFQGRGRRVATEAWILVSGILWLPSSKEGPGAQSGEDVGDEWGGGGWGGQCLVGAPGGPVRGWLLLESSAPNRE